MKCGKTERTRLLIYQSLVVETLGLTSFKSRCVIEHLEMSKLRSGLSTASYILAEVARFGTSTIF